MQRDLENCAYFSLDDAYNLAKIADIHEELEQHVNRGAIGDFVDYAEYIQDLIYQYRYQRKFVELISKHGNEKIKEAVQSIEYISYLKFPKNFGGIIKNIQSLSMFSENFSQKGYHRHNKKPLDEQIKEHTDFISNQNRTLVDRKVKIQTTTRAYLENHQHNYQSIIATRQQFNKTIPLNSVTDLLQQIDQLKKYADQYLKKSSYHPKIIELADNLSQRTQNLSAHLRFNQNPVD